MKEKLIHNKEAKRYEMHVENNVAFMEYISTKDKIFLTHTEVPRSMEGQGIGSQLVKLVLEEVKKADLTLIPLCPFVASYIKKNPEYKELVLKGVNLE